MFPTGITMTEVQYLPDRDKYDRGAVCMSSAMAVPNLP